MITTVVVDDPAVEMLQLGWHIDQSVTESLVAWNSQLHVNM